MARRGLVHHRTVRDEDKRPIRWRRYPYLFLIVCEDQKTEPYYFGTFIKEFPPDTVFLRAVGTGRSSIGVVERAIDERTKLLEEANKNVDEVWAVFDKDDAEQTPGNLRRFKDAFVLAESEKIKVAYSNEAFELWLLLHLSDLETFDPIPRKILFSNLEAKIKTYTSFENFIYEHGNTDIIDVLIINGNENDAIIRAENLIEYHKKNNSMPIEANPSTTVHILVKRLRDLIEWYSYGLI